MKKTSAILLLTFLIIGQGFVTSLSAQLKLTPVFGDNMVLQQITDAPIWGWDNPGQKISIKTSWDKKQYSAVCNSDGKWIIKVKTQAYGGSFNIVIKGSQTIHLQNVLIGEVWLCSGQSNMEMPLKGYKNQPVINSQELILNSTNENIRLFNVKHAYSRVPQSDCEGEWKISNPENCRDFSAVAYIFGIKLNSILNIPVGLIQSTWGGTDVLSWTDSITVADYKTVDLKEYAGKGVNYPSALYNGMIHPIIPFAIKGAIWYQGESNRSQPKLYDIAFPGMIENWRQLFENNTMPFYFVQISPFRYDGKHMGAYLRESQLKTMLTVPNTGMAVTMDIGDYNYIHPPRKQEVGDRLAYWALANDYGIDGVSFSGPVYKEMTITDNEIHLQFDYAEDGMSSFGKKLKNFQIAGEDKVFYPAEAKISWPSKVIVTSDEVEKPVAVRYCWFDFAKGNLFNNEGLPASSFRTDNW